MQETLIKQITKANQIQMQNENTKLYLFSSVDLIYKYLAFNHLDDEMIMQMALSMSPYINDDNLLFIEKVFSDPCMADNFICKFSTIHFCNLEFQNRLDEYQKRLNGYHEVTRAGDMEKLSCCLPKSKPVTKVDERSISDHTLKVMAFFSPVQAAMLTAKKASLKKG